jgi:membrane-bound ClpP family serine protease
MSGPRTALILAVLAVLVAVLGQGLVRLVEASGAREAPAVVLILLLAAFLGLLTAVVSRSMNLPGAMAPTALVLGWIVVPVIFGAIPAAATQLFAGDAALSATDAVALTVAVLAAAVTLNVSGSG